MSSMMLGDRMPRLDEFIPPGVDYKIAKFRSAKEFATVGVLAAQSAGAELPDEPIAMIERIHEVDELKFGGTQELLESGFRAHQLARQARGQIAA